MPWSFDLIATRAIDMAVSYTHLDVYKRQSVLNVGVFDEDTRFRSEGGFKKIDRIFQNKLESIVLELNEYLYDDGGKIA